MVETRRRKARLGGSPRAGGAAGFQSKESPMTRKHILRVFALLFLFAVSSLILGAGAPMTKATGPYQSALSPVGGVGTAWAAKCNGRICEVLQGINVCRFDGGGTSCVISNGVCTSQNGCK
jgi:hypothetical protein